MNVKLYLLNTIGDWNEFECANELAFRESSWRYDAVNSTTGAYGIFQHMSDYAPGWDAFNRFFATEIGNGYYIDFDLTVFPELQEDMKELSAILSQSWWITPNEKRAANVKQL